MKPPNHSSELNDADLQALFTADADAHTQPPADIDAAILTLARQAIKTDAELPSSTVHIAEQTTSSPTAMTKPRFRQAPAWLGAAAVVVLGIAIVPHMLQEPEIELSGETTPSFDSSASTTAMNEATIDEVVSDEAVSDDTARSEAIAVESTAAKMASDSEHAAARQEVANSIRSRQSIQVDTAPRALQLGAPLATQRLAESEEEWLETTLGVLPKKTDNPQQWEEHIRRLIKDERLEDARKSLVALRDAHPGYAEDIDIEELNY